MGNVSDDEGCNGSRDGGVKQECLTRQLAHGPNIAALGAGRKPVSAGYVSKACQCWQSATIVPISDWLTTDCRAQTRQQG
jgi:hypothetical protein